MIGNILLVPDVHGREFWKRAKDFVNSYEWIIFLGDYLDPYPWEGITPEEAFDNFKEVIEFKKENMDKVILLIGNHDYHYIDLDFMDCSRLDYKNRKAIHAVFEENKDLFKLGFQYLDEKYDYLFTHAGVYEEWLNKNGLVFENVLYGDVSPEALSQVSIWRGGCDEVSSCIWADIHEVYDNEPARGFIQYVGHTQQHEHPFKTKAITCIDCRRLFELDTKNNKLIKISDD